MKSTLRLSSLIFVWMLTITIGVNAQTKKPPLPTDVFAYEIISIQPEISEIILVRVLTYSKLPKVPTQTQKKNAVHGFIFKGVGGFAKGTPALKSLADTRDEVNKKVFFDKFFADGGDYEKYVSVYGDGSMEAEDRIKISKDLYKIGLRVSVNVKELRKALEAGGIKLLN